MAIRKSFLFLAGVLVLFMAAASAPSPLYSLYQQAWHFSPLALTIAFAAYAFGLLGTLLTCGSLSDYLGRKPILVLALISEIGSMLLLAFAPSIEWIIAARLLQGAATGLATATISAALLDTAPQERRGLAALFSTAVPPVGLGAGAIGTGLLVSFAPAPLQLVYWILFALLIGAVFIALRLPETATKHRAGWRVSLRPHIAVPQRIRPVFMAMLPGIIASWASAGLFLSLAPTITSTLVEGDAKLMGGLIIAILMWSAAIASLVFYKMAADRIIHTASIIAAVGILLVTVGVYATSLPLFIIGSAAAGVGFGPIFMAVFRNIMSHATASDRAGLAAAVFTVAYIAFSVPTLVAGIALSHFNLGHVVGFYGATVILLYLITALKANHTSQIDKA